MAGLEMGRAKDWFHFTSIISDKSLTNPLRAW